MKNIFITITIFSLFVTAQATSINECKTDIYFGNGVWNEYEDAESSRLTLEQYVINKEIVKGDPKLQKKYGKVKLAYNWGQGPMTDALETFYQLKEAGQVNDLEFFVVMYALTRGNILATLSATATKELYEPLNRDWEQGNVDEMWYKYYTESFKLSHKVLLLSHSQGNLFANRIHDTITPLEYRDYFANLQVASPANEVKAVKGSYVTLWGDPVINPIPGSMSGNAEGEAGHSFVAAYLAQSDPYTKIVTRLKALLSSLDSELTQWDIDEESDKDSKDYRVTVKHRFDTSSTVWEDVYPFNLSQKLYEVNGKYVKASCGGKSITDTWEGQKENEFWKIDNPQEEKIKAEKEFECSTAYADGYDIMATYCSYSRYDDAHFWFRDSGFVHRPSTDKPAYTTNLASQYNWCGIYGRGTINAWGGDSYCYEAHVYWSKEPTKYQNNQKKSWKTSKSMKIKNSDSNESYIKDNY